MNGTTVVAACMAALLCGMCACDDHKVPYSPGTPPVVETYPNTRVLFGVNHHWTARSGSMVSDTIYFKDGIPDTLPYNSLLTVYYYGYDNKRDANDYNDPEMEMRYQFLYGRYGVSIEGDYGSSYWTSWYPTQGAEDTYCYCNLDSVTMRIGTYDYQFLARCFDDGYNGDTTPDTVRFVGNYPPVIESVRIGYDAEPLVPDVHFVSIIGDTFYAGVGTVFQSRPDTVSPYNVEFDTGTMQFTFFYKIILKGNGHDDHREAPGSGIKGWRYGLRGSEEYYSEGEDEWMYDDPAGEYYQEIPFRIVMPFDAGSGGPDYSIIGDPPGYLGEQELTVTASDIHENERFLEGLRAISPEFDPDDPCTRIRYGKWVEVQRAPFRYARVDTLVRHFYIKLVF